VILRSGAAPERSGPYLKNYNQAECISHAYVWERVRRYERNGFEGVTSPRQVEWRPPSSSLRLAPLQVAPGGHRRRRWYYYRWQGSPHLVSGGPGRTFQRQHVRRSLMATTASSRCSIAARLIQVCCAVATVHPMGRKGRGAAEARRPLLGHMFSVRVEALLPGLNRTPLER
jgi:hypothetical protein